MQSIVSLHEFAGLVKMVNEAADALIREVVARTRKHDPNLHDRCAGVCSNVSREWDPSIHGGYIIIVSGYWIGDLHDDYKTDRKKKNRSKLQSGATGQPDPACIHDQVASIKHETPINQSIEIPPENIDQPAHEPHEWIAIGENDPADIRDEATFLKWIEVAEHIDPTRLLVLNVLFVLTQLHHMF
ncbi:hypothetical protein DFJ73DRAFT_822551 [Zopfochytrium polystomum]|nr:hypothetical protein DFJ73DRAFT_822551 [Zopfochytrium polystomum]